MGFIAALRMLSDSCPLANDFPALTPKSTAWTTLHEKRIAKRSFFYSFKRLLHKGKR